jgi:hypothetical protein
MVSTKGGTSYDILYILDGASTNAPINKYSYVSGNWVANGSFTNQTGGDSLFATTNGTGGIYLYLTTGVSKSNSLVRVTDAGGWNGTIHIVSTNVLYTAKGGTYLKGITFVPQQTAYAGQLIPPPVLTAQTTASVTSSFTVTNTPDDSAWRAAITGITVNGSTLTTAAYDTTQSGMIIFDPSQSALLQTPGLKTIVISATGYSTNSIAQTVTIGAASKLVMKTEPSATILAGATFSTQPAMYVEDANGNLVGTNNSTIVTATVGTGTGSLTGILTATAVNGVVTFSGLAAPTTAQNGLLLTFTASGLTSAVDDTSITVNPVVTAPTAITLAASNITAGSALFSGSVTPNGGTTAYWFEFGADTSYGSFTVTNSTSVTGTFGIVVSNLLQGRTYHYQLVATNSAGTGLGGDISFNTLAVTPPQFGSGSGIISGGGSVPFQFSFTNTPGASFSVLATTNIALPINQWSNLGTATEVSLGQYQFSDPNATNNPAQFYILESQ